MPAERDQRPEDSPVKTWRPRRPGIGRGDLNSTPVWGVAIVGAVCVVKVVLANRWSLLADEAYYAVWAELPALGYYDQPPLVAWVLALVRGTLGDHDLAVRIPAIAAGVLAPVFLLGFVRDRTLWLLWWAGIPALAWLTGFMTPDALLLLAWTASLAAAIRGGRFWWLAGVCIAGAVLAKYTAVLLWPLLWIATGDWKDRRMWSGVGITALLVSPHVAWLAQNDFVSVGFQLSEGLWHPDSPGLLGPLAVLGQQLGVATPFAVLAATAVFVRGPSGTRAERIAWWTSAPVAALFVLASFGGPPEAHWLAPVWVGVGVRVANRSGWVSRAGWLAVGTGLFTSALLVLHAERRVFRLPLDPALRVHEGRPLARAVAGWALPLGVGPREPRAAEATPVLTERYQEAALIRWYTGIPAVAAPGCGRPDQYDLWGGSVPDRFLFVRPHTSGPAICTDDTHPEKVRHPLNPRDDTGREVGRWDLFEVHR